MVIMGQEKWVATGLPYCRGGISGQLPAFRLGADPSFAIQFYYPDFCAAVPAFYDEIRISPLLWGNEPHFRI